VLIILSVILGNLDFLCLISQLKWWKLDQVTCLCLWFSSTTQLFRSIRNRWQCSVVIKLLENKRLHHFLTVFYVHNIFTTYKLQISHCSFLVIGNIELQYKWKVSQLPWNPWNSLFTVDICHCKLSDMIFKHILKDSSLLKIWLVRVEYHK
jgi:hypothetical protein